MDVQRAGQTDQTHAHDALSLNAIDDIGQIWRSSAHLLIKSYRTTSRSMKKPASLLDVQVGADEGKFLFKDWSNNVGYFLG
ncbi:hypothetical protein E2P81_ATG01773 [Venturia nashicola]|uniref:Uncharacterized protein n=1 Tax=Venturia nashicola TaxID=86259 RepID=A0A4Z1P1W6_9PEZI|nr:hypothetical protein E6O75_ATG01821 [Venturia nashicola]TLD35470.1 hypothetical protein E2P81_ATG01773 [Venturia nashicola]